MHPDPPTEPGEPRRPEPPATPPGLPIYDPDEFLDDAEFDDEELDEGPRVVLITGASGNIGRKLREAWSDTYELVLIDVAAGIDDPGVVAADLSELNDEWIALFDNVDTVVHLAGNPNEFSSWEDLVQANLDAVTNVFHAAVLSGVERVIFASSNHAMGGYRELGDAPITVDLPPMPDSPYGATKFFGERLGRSMAHAFDMNVIALRLGWIQRGENRPETLQDDWARAMWLSNADLVRLFECAIECELEEGEFVVANGMSNNQNMRWDLSEASEKLGFYPEDDAYAEEG